MKGNSPSTLWPFCHCFFFLCHCWLPICWLHSIWVWKYPKFQWILIWLVVWTPLKNISQLGWLFPIYGKIKNVPNHQPVIHFRHLKWHFWVYHGRPLSRFAVSARERSFHGLPFLLHFLQPFVMQLVPEKGAQRSPHPNFRLWIQTKQLQMNAPKTNKWKSKITFPVPVFDLHNQSKCEIWNGFFVCMLNFAEFFRETLSKISGEWMSMCAKMPLHISPLGIWMF